MKHKKHSTKLEHPFFKMFRVSSSVFQVPRRGFSLVEILVVVALIGIVATIATAGFPIFTKQNALDKGTAVIRSVLEEARSMSLNSNGFSEYGVHFESSRVVRFRGVIYSAGSSDNVPKNLGSYVMISAINLGGSSDVVFKKRSGEADPFGTVELSRADDSSVKKIITIYRTGLAE